MTLVKFLFVILITCTLNQKASAINNDQSFKLKVKFSELPEQNCSLFTNSPEIINKVWARMFRDQAMKKLDHPSFHKKLSEYKSFQSYGEDGNPLSFCSATVVSGTQAVTAAHCVSDLPSGDIFLRCPGNIFRKINRKTFKIHRNYNDFGNDIAMVETFESIGLKPIKLVDSKEKLNALLQINKCGVFGFGKTGKLRNFGTLGGTSRNSNDIFFIEHDPYLEFIRELSRLMINNPEIKINLERMVGLSGLSSKNKSSEFLGIVKKHVSTRGGDSGGGLYCEDKNREKYLVGVTIAISPSREKPQMEIYENVLNKYEWLKRDLSHAPISVEEKIKSKMKQVLHFDKSIKKCVDSFEAKKIELPEQFNIALQDVNPRQLPNKTHNLLSKLESFKEKQVEFIEKCFDTLFRQDLKRTIMEIIQP